MTRPSRALLLDGSPAVLTPLGPGDVGEVQTLHDELDERDRWLRFGTLHPADLPEYLTRTLAPGSGVVSLGARVRGRLVGVAQVIPTGDGAGDVAVVVASPWRAHGVATVLLEAVATAAVRQGVDRLVAMVMAENGPVMRVLSDLGMPVGLTREDTAVRVEVLLHSDDRYERATAERYRGAAAASLDPVLRPRSVAVVGVSRREGSVGRTVLRGILAGGFGGDLWVVHPDADRIDGVPCAPSLSTLPVAPDLVVVTVPAVAVTDVVEAAGRRGARSVLVISSGLASLPGGADRLRGLADDHALRLVGPNTVGVVGPLDGPGGTGRLDATFAGQAPPSGDVGLVTQSGGLAIAAVAGLARLGLGLSAGVSVGDALDVGAADVLAWFDRHAGTRSVVLHAENETDLRGLVRVARHLGERVPVFALSTGTSAAGERAAASHTARAATPRVVREAAYAAAGILAVDDLTSLTAAVGLLSGQPLPRGPRVAVLTNVGGGGVLTADALVAAGLSVDPLPDPLRERLAALLPDLAETTNPVDTSAAVTAGVFADALTCLLDSPDVDAVVTVTSPTAVSDPGAGVGPGAAASTGATPLVDVRPTRATSCERLDHPGPRPDRFVVSVADPGTAARALALAVRRGAWLQRRPGRPVLPSGVDVRAARAVLTGVLHRAAGGDWLRPDEVTGLCEAAGLRTVPTTSVTTAAEAEAEARRGGRPVAVKGVVDGVVHKADAGLLRLPVSDPAEVGRVVAEWVARTGPRWRCAVLQPVVPPGDELLVGAVRDASAGPVLALGPGGRATDALGHRVHRLAPLSDDEADAMIEATGLFGTAHGRTLDRAGVRDCLHRVGWLADVLPEIAEIDVNPLVVGSDGSVALDVRVRVEPDRR